jgi:F420-dependent oxidoreductase-like protein
MRLAANLDYREATSLARAAERLGYDAVLAPEGYTSDAASVLGMVAATTDSIGLVSGIMQIPARPPALAALTAATLDAISGGRFRLGLGVSNPDVSRGWYDVPFDRPLARTRAYVDVVRQALTGDPVQVNDGAPVHVLTTGSRPDLPIYLAAVGPGNLRLAGEIADGWIGVFTPPEAVAAAVTEIRAGRGERGMAGFEVFPTLPAAIAPDVASAVDALRGHYVYLLGIGEAEKNIYCRLAGQMGFERDVKVFRERLTAGDRAGAGAAIPAELIDLTSLAGPIARLAERMQAFAAAGATTLGIKVTAAAVPTDARLHMLRHAAEARELAGLPG